MSRSKHLFLLEGVYFCSFCTLYAYLVSILLDFGYSEVQCGYVTMLQYVVFLFAGPLYGQMIDNHVSPRKLFIILLSGGLILTPFLSAAFHHGFWMTMLVSGVISFLDFCGPNVLDTWTNTLIRKDATVDYGVIRSAGSLFYATAALISGYLIVPLGMNILFVLHFITLALSIIMAIRMEDPNLLPDLNPAASIAPAAGSFFSSLKVLLANRDYCIFLLCGSIYYFATRSVNTFMQVILNSIGGDVSSYGLSVFLYCVGECILMQVASRLLRRGLPIRTLFVVSLLAMAIRMVFLAVLHNMIWIMLTQGFLSIGFACFLRFNIEYVAGLFGPEYSGRAILVSVGFTQGVGCITGNLLGGYLLSGIGVANYLYVCTALFILTLAIFILGHKPGNQVRIAPNA